MRKRRVLVYGFYNKNNIGDDFFIEAFRHLFPELDLYFTDRIISESLIDIDGIFFGGGSFLFAKPNISNDALTILHSKKIFYLGVGAETQIHEAHKSLMSVAKFIATRSEEQVNYLRETVNKNTFYYPDLVYSLQERIKTRAKIPGSVLLIPNMEVVSRNSDPAWKHNSWEYFKSEFSQFIDMLIDAKYQINSFAFCTNKDMNDNWAAVEVFNKLRCRNDYLVSVQDRSFESVTQFLSGFETIISQRYHGTILSEMLNVPNLTISHHDKLKNLQVKRGKIISYYGLSKQKLFDEFNELKNINYTDVMPIESNTFTKLHGSVLNLI